MPPTTAPRLGKAVLAAAYASMAANAGSAAAAAHEPRTPKDFGARYGQALGASLVCPFIHLLPEADALLKRHSGDNLAAFQAEAKRVALIWQKTLACDPRADINRCRILSEKSCSEAIREIGPEGTVAKGLIEFRK